MKYSTGIRILEQDDGTVILDFIQHSKLVFSSPIEVRLVFNNWTEAINFLKIWDTTAYIQFWEKDKKGE